MKKVNPNVKTKYVSFDFSKHLTIQEYQDLIAKPLEGIDIAMLFLNAGVVHPGLFSDLKNLEV